MKKIVFLLLFLPVFVYSAEISDVIHGLVDQLAAVYTAQAKKQFYSKQTVSIIEIREGSKEIQDNYIGAAVEELLKNSLADSLVFKLIDRKNLAAAMKEIKLSLTGLTDTNDAPALGKIRGVKLLLDGSVTSSGSNFIITLRLTDVETTEVVASVTGSIPKDVMIETSSRIAYEYITANGIGLSFFLTPTRYLVLNQSTPQKVGDDQYHTGAGGAKLTYRFNKNWKFSIDTDINKNDVFFDLRNIGTMQNLTAYDDVFADAAAGKLLIKGFWNSDGSFTPSNTVKADLYGKPNFYTLSQQTTNVSFVLSYVYPVNRKLNISAGIGPHISLLRYHQVYDNVPILINEGVAFKRYEINMDFFGLGGTASIGLEYFVLPRFALNFGISGFYSYILPKTGDNMNAWSPTTGEYYYGSNDFSIESFGLNPFMMPDGRMITETVYPTNYVKASLGASIYF